MIEKFHVVKTQTFMCFLTSLCLGVGGLSEKGYSHAQEGGIQMKTAIIDGKECAYQEMGEGYPILLGHSFLWDSQMWQPQLEALSKEFRCIAPDLWNHGQSGSINTDHYSIEQLADDNWKLMQHLGISEFAIVGLSVGGMWGTQLALDHPNAVSALVIMDTFVGSEPPLTQKKYFGMMDFLDQNERFADALLNQVVPLFFSPRTLRDNPLLVDTFRESLASTPANNIHGITALGRAIFARNCLLNQLPKIFQPTLVVVGRDDIPRPPKESEEMAQLLPNAELRMIDHAGHISSLEQPEVVSSMLLDFLKQHTSSENLL